ncbi:hypothetical protein [Polaromonas sp.]|uniref:hypothetical protein n=1 Tax=Polaromonas sp. TaxID=1869339 RepID=UPI003569AB9C
MTEHLTEPFTRPVAAYSQGADQAWLAPPKLHWGLMLLFTVLTLGLFLLVWMFIQSSWARKIDPESNAATLFIAYLVLFIPSQLLTEGSGAGLKGLGALLMLVSYVVFYVGEYSIRRSMLNHYNKVEPISLEMSGAMVFFFSSFYLRYHMTRIAKRKMTGVLDL